MPRLTCYWPICLEACGEWFVTAVNSPEQLTEWLAGIVEQGYLDMGQAERIEDEILCRMAEGSCHGR